MKLTSQIHQLNVQLCESGAFPPTHQLPDATCSGTTAKLLLHIPAVKPGSPENCNQQVRLCFTGGTGVAGQDGCLRYGPVPARPVSPSACWCFEENQSWPVDIFLER